MPTSTSIHPVLDQAPTTESFRKATLRGLRKNQKRVPSKFLYDERGSKLFDAICELDEYYPTRTEIGIMRENVSAMAEAIGPAARLVEYGSGSSLKTRILLERMGEDLATYVPVDISKRHLLESAEALAEDHPAVPIQPVCADYTASFELPESPRPARRTVGYYPGSTIGNFPRAQARAFLSQIADTTGPDGGLLIGVDLKKDVDVMTTAYDDAEGVTAAFSKNLLRRMNQELNATFDLDAFEHQVRWNEARGCVESHLRSTIAQSVTVAGESFAFEEGETIHTEDSHKYTLEGFASLAAETGFEVESVWTDDRSYFSVQYCTTSPDSA
ncbi:L-histidine N(alpha)-methyltransferase [Salinibacter altiplanensis]|uniref:L-histidine N(alpha)-methyltransferase n=1 Tax=Salinibacter altiplanensis TaxID=1803181 RepID=UPI000C9FE583|nr:L-histidine N(alpha)-methyltransferase [Salinibacter altiplanensis]